MIRKTAIRALLCWLGLVACLLLGTAYAETAGASFSVGELNRVRVSRDEWGYSRGVVVHALLLPTSVAAALLASAIWMMLERARRPRAR